MTTPVLGLVRCGLCGTPCIPVADFDAPTCLHCEALMQTVLDRAARSMPAPPAPPSLSTPASPAVITALVDELCPPYSRRRGARRSAEPSGASA